MAVGSCSLPLPLSQMTRIFSSSASTRERKITSKCKLNSVSLNTLSNSVSDKALLDIQNSGVIACLRAPSAEVAMEAALAALDAGISVLEIVVSTPGVFEIGTVLCAKDAKDASEFGAKFLMSPVLVKDILVGLSGDEALYIPGAMTPTEILSAFSMGAKIVKVYPVSALGGTKYISALKRPFSHIPMVASQGITIDLVGEYIAQGASAVVLSDAIFDKKAMSLRNFDVVHQLASRAALQGKEAVKRIKRLPLFPCTATFSRGRVLDLALHWPLPTIS
ncbi:PREDICTED: uncharacterized protein LOC109159005 isoform X2 [Ipomoea nil]|uniref:uncharacterized protein LOC109159005 isoform X2 n=1 Tax=Ipomoea nil TaxID=35883 RepID=UPI000901FC8F|nr:PREDICTED: uncharacterized protein LOC109159005 isoform X2 [Ipomoea nil]